MTRATASKAGLLSACQWWATPHAEWAETTSAAADKGSRFHAAIAEYVTSGQIALAPADDIAPLLVSAMAWVDHFGRDKLKAEVALAWSPVTDTAEVIGENIGRAYGEHQARGLLCMAADLVAISMATRVGYIGDWSTGDGSGKGPQLRCNAFALARAFDLDSVTVEALEVDATGVRHVCTETLDSFALAASAGEVAEALALVPAAQPQPGPHCSEMYCPARATCPAIRDRIEQILPPADLVRHKWGLTIESGAHAKWLYDQAKAVEAAAKLVKDAVRAYVPEGGLVLDDGSVFAEGSRTMSRFDKSRAIGLLREKGATEEEIEACSQSVVESSGLRVTGGAAKPRKRRAA